MQFEGSHRRLGLYTMQRSSCRVFLPAFGLLLLETPIEVCLDRGQMVLVGLECPLSAPWPCFTLRTIGVDEASHPGPIEVFSLST